MFLMRGFRRFVIFSGCGEGVGICLAVLWFLICVLGPLWMWPFIHVGFAHSGEWDVHTRWVGGHLFTDDSNPFYVKYNTPHGTPWSMIYSYAFMWLPGYLVGMLVYVYQTWRYESLGKRGNWKRMVKRYGRSRGRDTYGKLWRIPRLTILGSRDASNPIDVVQVKDASPEDGKYKKYYLRVPQCYSAHEAVAWTFGCNTAGEYKPQVQT